MQYENSLYWTPTSHGMQEINDGGIGYSSHSQPRIASSVLKQIRNSIEGTYIYINDSAAIWCICVFGQNSLQHICFVASQVKLGRSWIRGPVRGPRLDAPRFNLRCRMHRKSNCSFIPASTGLDEEDSSAIHELLPYIYILLFLAARLFVGHPTTGS